MAKKMTFNIDGLIGLNAKGMISSLDSIKRGLSNLSGKEVDKLGGLLMKATEQTKEFEMAAKRTFKDTTEIKAANKAYAGLEKTLKQIDFIMSNSDFGAGSAKIQKVLRAGKQEIEGLQKVSQEFSKTMNETFAKFKGQHNIKLTADDLIEASMSLENIGRQVAVLTRSSNALKIDTTELDEAKATLKEIKQDLIDERGSYAVNQRTLKEATGLSDEEWSKASSALEKQKLDVRDLSKRYTSAANAVKDLEKKMKTQTIAVEEQKKKNAELIDTLKATSAEYIKIQESINLGEIFGEEFRPLVDDLPNTMEGIAQAIERISNSSELIKTDALKHMGEAAKDLGSEMKTAGTELDGINESLREMTELEKQVDSLQNSMMQFFSLTSGWRLLQRAMKEAHKTVQELDAAMTEIAVVSEYSLDAIWAMRQGFTDAATDMGAKTLDLISATKLYVQQGLDLVDAQKIGTETIKMARIANLDGAEATSLMTAAIRGFHMELTEANKVNDVYSVLAAKSAADTREIAVAMSKTASIASSAGSEFESMSAFLTQIIETTREAPETAGTAMKTIIARFQELKKPMDEIGEVDGEIVDANAIETALRSAGVALRNMQGEFRDFDDVIFELSEKWDTLDLMTQRYIATMAAGSRQQSRFIALVSNHARLMELTGYATNSAGAAAEQFAKTQESLQAKMNRLANAMGQFWTNLADSTVIKGAIDLATLFMNIINGIIKAFSGLPGVVGKAGSVFATFMVTLGGFKAAKGLIDGFFEHVVKGSLRAGRDGGAGLGDEMNKSLILSIAKSPKIVQESLKGINFEKMTTGLENAISSHVKGYGEKISKEIATLTPMRHSPGIMEEIVNLEKAQAGLTSQSEKLRDAFSGVFTERQLKLMSRKQAMMLMENGVLKQGEPLLKAKQQLQYQEYILERKGIPAILMKVGLLQQENLAQAKGNVLLAAKNMLARENAAAVWSQIKGLVEQNILMIKGASTIALTVATVYLLTKAISAMIKKAKDGTLEGRMRLAAEQTKKAAEAANEAKEAYDKLLGDQGKYTELQDTLSVLTEGTEEWRDALIEANDQVLELLRNYPTLADYMERDSQGRLTISPEGQRVIKEQGRQQVETAQMASLAAQLDQSILRREAVFKDSLKQGAGGPEMLRALIAAQEKTETPIFKGGADSEELKKIREATGFSVDALLGLENAFYHFTTTMDKVNRQIEKQAGLFFTSGLDPRAASSELGKSLSNIFLKGMFDSPIEERVKATADSITFATGRALGASNVAKELMSKYEVVVSDDTSEKDVLKALYKAVTKQESIPEEIAKDNKALRQEIARVVEVNRISEDVKFLYNKILSFGEERADEFSALFSDGGKGFTQELAEKISDEEGVEQYLNKIADKWGFDLEEVADLMGISIQEMTETVISNAEMDEKRRERANRIIEDRLKDHQGRIQALTRDMDSETYSALVDKLNRLFAANGDLPGVIGEIEKLLEAVSPEKAKAVLREIMSTNWADKDLLEGLRKRLLELDDDIPKESLDIFISQMIDLNNAVSAVDVTSFINSLGGIGKVIDEIRNKTDRIFSAALYDEIYKYDENLALANFERNLDGTYTYVGDSIKSFADELMKAFGSIEEKIAQEEQRLEASKILVKVEGLEDEDQYTKDFLQEVLKDLQGVDLSTLAIEGLDADLNVDALEDDAVKDILSKLFKIGEEQMIILDGIKALRGMDTATKYADWSSGDLVRGIAESTDTKNIEEMSNALIRQASAAKVTEIAIRKYQKEVQSTDKSVKEAALKEFEFAIEIAKTVEKLEQFGSVASKHISDLKEMDEKSWAYKATLAELADEFNKIFETDLDETFFADKENFKNLELALEGDREAWKKLIIEIDKASVASDQFVKDFGVDAKNIKGITDALDQLKFSITGEADLTALAHALIDAGVQIDQVAAAIEALGYMNVKFEMEYTWEKLWLNPNQYKMIKVPKLIQASGTKAKIPAAPKAPSFRPKDTKGKGSSEKETDPWKNSYDWLHNLVQETNKEIRDRNRMEQDLNRILEGRNVTAKDIYDNMEKQVRSLEKQRDLLVQQRSGRLEEKQRIEVEYADVKRYASYNEQIGYVEIDWNKLEQLSDRKGNNEEAERVDAYIKELERIADTMNSIDDSLYDIEDQIDDILKMGKDDYLNLEDRILNAVVQAQRDLIDEMSAIHDSMTNANARVLDRLQEGIAASRRVREDTKIESDISAKEARLALLRQDTSRANQLEIMRLEEELTQDRQDYTDKLIDDKITELQMQNDAAAEQRQMQIDLANDQLEMSQKYGLLWERVEKLTKDGVDIQGELIKGSELESLLRRQEGFLGMSEIQKMEWTSELERQLASAVAYIQANNRQQESIFNELTPGSIAKEPAKPGESGVPSTQTPPSTGSGGGGAQDTSYYPKVTAAQVKAKGLDPNSIVDTLKAGGFASSHSERKKIAKANGIAGYTGTAAQNSQLRQLLNQGKLKRYKKGGLIDFTGPAWVDGSTTDPESILDAQDTRNLVALRDVLESLRRTGGGSGSSGDNYFDIRVQVDSLADDYDVDDLTNRIKKQIYDDATYRNVQVIRNLR